MLKWREKRVQFFIKALLTGLVMVLVDWQAAEAVDKTLFLREVRESFNSPLSSRISSGAVVFIAVAIIFLWLGMVLDKVRTEKRQRLAQKAYQEKKLMRMSSSQQKRQWFRVKTNTEILWEPLGKSEIPEEGEFQKDRLVDASGGGLCFATAAQLSVDDKIRLLLPVSNKQSIFLTGQVVRVTEKEEANLVAIKFLDIRESQRDKIIAALLDIQRGAIKAEKEEEYNNQNQDQDVSSST